MPVKRRFAVGTWGSGPFDSDYAADFVDQLNASGPSEQLGLVHDALERVARSADRVEEGAEAVAAAALVASQCPGGERYASAGGDLTGPLVRFPADLRILADTALARALDQHSGLSVGWVDPDDAIARLTELEEIRILLVPR
ncbi:MAG: DUF4259 domain-containing protein [Nonomuraea sp.]|nr:DUF4259 domain-containing protein [Nonomuraea sp.]